MEKSKVGSVVPCLVKRVLHHLKEREDLQVVSRSPVIQDSSAELIVRPLSTTKKENSLITKPA